MVYLVIIAGCLLFIATELWVRNAVSAKEADGRRALACCVYGLLFFGIYSTFDEVQRARRVGILVGVVGGLAGAIWHGFRFLKKEAE